MARARNGTSEYVKLEQRLVLLAWLNGLFGDESDGDLLADMKEAAEGLDASARGVLAIRCEEAGVLDGDWQRQDAHSNPSRATT